jgi:hypothetical protein
VLTSLMQEPANVHARDQVSEIQAKGGEATQPRPLHVFGLLLTVISSKSLANGGSEPSGHARGRVVARPVASAGMCSWPRVPSPCHSGAQPPSISRFSSRAMAASRSAMTCW